jgi:hypothetical protein
MRTRFLDHAADGPTGDDLVAPVSGLWQVVTATLACIEQPANALDAVLGVPPRTVQGLRRVERLDYLAYWEWCLTAIRPDEVTIRTPTGLYRLPLAPAVEAYLERQVNRRFLAALGAGCSLEGARASTLESRRRAVERLAKPMLVGRLALTDPIDVVADICATQQVEPNNMTLATGATIAFIDRAITGTSGKTTEGIRRVWDFASRLGCTLTIRCGLRTYILSPSTRPIQVAIEAVVAGYATKPPRWRSEDPETQTIIAALVAGEATVRSLAAERGVTRQAINARLQAAGFGMRELTYHQGVRAARTLLRHLQRDEI